MKEYKGVSFNKAVEILEKGFVISNDVEITTLNDHSVIRDKGYVVAFYYENTGTLVVR